jgi:SAM-dependent methyltransferase
MNVQNFYDLNFFENLEKTAYDSSTKIVPLILDRFNPKSIIDIGCGNGIWLNTFEKFGINNYLGIDGDYVKKEFFHANFSKFLTADLEVNLDLNIRFDLAVCLEVGEHLPSNCAEILVKTLTNHSDIIIFSAAIPNQSGTNHINEQPQSYWASIFNKFGYEPFDIIRPVIWNEFSISYWYRQNIVVYKKTGKNLIDFKFLDKIHPELMFRNQKITSPIQQFLISPKYVLTRFLKKRGIL